VRRGYKKEEIAGQELREDDDGQIDSIKRKRLRKKGELETIKLFLGAVGRKGLIQKIRISILKKKRGLF